MRKGKLGRTSGHRRSLFRNLMTVLFLNGRIRTTEAKAKNIRPLAEEVITLAKRGDLHSRRLAAASVIGKDALKKLFDEIAPRYKDRPGGYTRITKLEQRRGDAASMVILELVQ
ncbi:MAG TPA: 50S ribosomal protein L17 [Firmicutes bacterium]|nr:50S ribosomal protein L17 [Bacillota bacterium]HHY98448.1 50S ribosomal protein L17 [Bacillota bacterium]